MTLIQYLHGHFITISFGIEQNSCFGYWYSTFDVGDIVCVHRVTIISPQCVIMKITKYIRQQTHNIRFKLFTVCYTGSHCYSTPHRKENRHSRTDTMQMLKAVINSSQQRHCSSKCLSLSQNMHSLRHSYAHSVSF